MQATNKLGLQGRRQAQALVAPGFSLRDSNSTSWKALSKLVRGVGFEPTKAYATGSLIPRRILSVARLEGSSCPFDLNPAHIASCGSREPPLVSARIRVWLKTCHGER